jgi:two-component system sensor histidine kinase DesK
MAPAFFSRWPGGRRAVQDQTEGVPTDADALQTEPFPSYLIAVIWLAWLPFFIPTLITLVQSHPPLWRLWLSLGGVAVFFATYIISSLLDARYLASTPLAPQVTPLRSWLVLGVLCLLATGLTILNGGGSGWLSLFYYVSGYSGGRLSIGHTAWTIAIILLYAAAAAVLSRTAWDTLVISELFIVLIGVLISCIGYFLRTIQRLRIARAEIARLATTAERLRIARDLHDLLGYNLSLIALKSELAGRLLEPAPERAAGEIRDIEQVARTTLQEVREAVSRYRQPALVDELRAAQQILAAAGIRYRLEGGQHLAALRSPSLEVTLSWIVREGVTNVIKHSHAHECRIAFTRADEAICLEIENDGAPGERQGVVSGNGLRGLAERVIDLGGSFEAAPLAGNFHLAATLPLTPRTAARTAVPPPPSALAAENARERS